MTTLVSCDNDSLIILTFCYKDDGTPLAEKSVRTECIYDTSGDTYSLQISYWLGSTSCSGDSTMSFDLAIPSTCNYSREDDDGDDKAVRVRKLLSNGTDDSIQDDYDDYEDDDDDLEDLTFKKYSCVTSNTPWDNKLEGLTTILSHIESCDTSYADGFEKNYLDMCTPTSLTSSYLLSSCSGM